MTDDFAVPRTLGQAIGQAVAKARKQAPKWSQSTLAQKAGVSRDVVFRLEHGGEVRWENAESIALVLDEKTGGRLLSEMQPARSKATAELTDTPEQLDARDAETAASTSSLQKSPTEPQPDVAAPPRRRTDTPMDPGDRRLFGHVEGAWNLLQSTKERRAFVRYIRKFFETPPPAAQESTRKKAAR